MKRLGGIIIIAAGIVHTVVGIFVFAKPNLEILRFGLLNGVLQNPHPFEVIAREGFYQAIEPVYARLAGFWFFWAGLSWIILGSFCHWFESRYDRATPAFIAWSLLAYGAIGTLILPLSGLGPFTLTMVYLILTARSERGAT